VLTLLARAIADNAFRGYTIMEKLLAKPGSASTSGSSSSHSRGGEEEEEEEEEEEGN